MTCDDFDDGVDELALGLLDEPDRGRLLDHAASCARCQARLDDLIALTERLLLVAPQIDPPAGFEGRTLERMGARARDRRAGGDLRAQPGRSAPLAALRAGRRRGDPRPVLAAGVGVGRWRDRGRGATPATACAPDHGVIVSAAGAELGTVTLVLDPQPHVLVAIDTPRRATDTRTCQLRLPGQPWQTVGTWSYDEIASGIWAVGVDPALLDAAAMRVIGPDGQVLATATIE